MFFCDLKIFRIDISQDALSDWLLIHTLETSSAVAFKFGDLCLIQSMSLLSFCTPRKIFDFLMFSEGIERD